MKPTTLALLTALLIASASLAMAGEDPVVGANQLAQPSQAELNSAEAPTTPAVQCDTVADAPLFEAAWQKEPNSTRTYSCGACGSPQCTDKAPGQACGKPSQGGFCETAWNLCPAGGYVCTCIF